MIEKKDNGAAIEERKSVNHDGAQQSKGDVEAYIDPVITDEKSSGDKIQQPDDCPPGTTRNRATGVCE